MCVHTSTIDEMYLAAFCNLAMFSAKMTKGRGGGGLTQIQILGVDLLALPLGLLVLVESVLVQAPEVAYHANVVQLGGLLLPPGKWFFHTHCTEQCVAVLTQPRKNPREDWL